jgi:hypothetical protein
MRLWAFAFSALLASSVSLEAGAFCRTSTEGLAEGCRPSGSNCCTVGKPIYWRNACIGFSMQRLGTQVLPTISFVEASRTVAQAFNVWTSASCSGSESGSSRVSIDVRQFPPVDCSNVETKLDLPNQNLIVFRDSVWNHRDPDNVLALTTVSFDKTSGEIRGADLEFNSANVKMVCPSNNDAQDDDVSCFDAPPPDGAYDFASIVTHEVGHFLGMAHSNNPQATMAPQYTNGRYTLRTLTADDIAGICSIYPPDGTRRVGTDGADSLPQGPCDPTPLNGFSSECAEKKCFIFCCSSAGAIPPPRPSTGFGLAATGLALAALGRRRSNRRARS